MGYVMVDVETDGPIPGDYSMISFVRCWLMNSWIKLSMAS
jgi:hypothetical protein